MTYQGYRVVIHAEGMTMAEETAKGTTTADRPAGVQEALRKIAASGLKERFKKQDRSGAYEAELAMEHSSFARPRNAKTVSAQPGESEELNQQQLLPGCKIIHTAEGPEIKVLTVPASVPLVPIPRPDSKRFPTKGLIFTHGIKELYLDKLEVKGSYQVSAADLTDADRLLIIRNMARESLPDFQLRIRREFGDYSSEERSGEEKEPGSRQGKNRASN